MTDILTSLHGRRVGLDADDTLIINRRDGIQVQPGGFVSSVVTVTSAELLALNATPKTILAAPGAGLAIIPRLVLVNKPAGTAYGGIATGEDLVLKYTNGSGSQCSSAIETTGFLDQTTTQTRVVGPPGASGATAVAWAPTANAAVVMHLLVGEITTGDSPLYVRVWYQVIPTTLP